jgi:hypothetical protein
MTVLLGTSTASAEDVLAVRWEQSRVRPQDASLTAVVHGAAERSTTLRTLITRIDGTNGIVYIHAAKCPRTMTACLFQQLQLSGVNRVMHIGVAAARRADIDVAASVGHELQHAWEVLQRPDVTSTEGMLGVWLAGLKLAKEPYETYEAIEAGIRVRRELSSARSDAPH